MSKIKEFFCLASDNNGFTLKVVQNPDGEIVSGELSRIQNYLPQQSNDLAPLIYMKHHDPEKISGKTLDESIANAKARIKELGFDVLHWKEERQ